MPADAPPTEFGFRCGWCGHSEAWTTDTAAQAAAIGHIFTEHRDWWDSNVTDEMPEAARHPERFGRRFEEWERQS